MIIGFPTFLYLLPGCQQSVGNPNFPTPSPMEVESFQPTCYPNSQTAEDNSRMEMSFFMAFSYHEYCLFPATSLWIPACARMTPKKGCHSRDPLAGIHKKVKFGDAESRPRDRHDKYFNEVCHAGLRPGISVSSLIGINDFPLIEKTEAI
jgi:hypothetical protein